MSASRSERGLTLLELLVAVAIFAVTGAALYPTVTSALAARRDALERARSHALARAILERAESDVAGCFDVGIASSYLPLLVIDDPERAGFGDERAVAELTTVDARGTASPDAPVMGDELAVVVHDRGDQSHVLWRLEEGGELARYEVRPPRGEEVDWSEARRRSYGDGASLALRVFFEEEWRSSWHAASGGNESGRLPERVRLEVRVDDGEREPVVLVSSVAMPSAFEAGGALRSWGARRGSGRGR